MSPDFLSRWSQRKREAAKVTDASAPGAPAAAPVAPGDPLTPEPPQEAAESGITPEELEALPKPEEITSETDITAFLRKGVPDALKNAALRRAWALDPVIRDYVNPAREYAYDWNVPGGVPGSSPLLPTDDVEAMVRAIFGDSPPEAPPAGSVEEAAEARASGEQAEPENASSEASAAALPPPAPELQPVRLGCDTEEQDIDKIEESFAKPSRRRHGGAIPI